MSLGNILLGSKIKVYPQSALDYLIGSGITAANAASMFSITDTDLDDTPTAGVLIGSKTGVGTSLGMGAYDGSSVYSLYQRSRDNLAATNTRNAMSSTAVYRALGRTTNAESESATATSFANNTFNFTFGTAPEFTTNFIGLLFKTADIAVDYLEFSGATTVVSISDLSFEPNFFLCFSALNNVLAGNIFTHSYIAVGVATGTANQYSISYSDVHNVTPTNTARILTNNSLSYHTALAQTLSLTSVASNGYTITRSSTTGSASMIMVAMRLDSLPIISTQQSPASTGNSVINVGSNTKKHIILGTFNTALNTVQDGYGISISVFDENKERSLAIVSNDNVATSNAESYFDTKAVSHYPTVGNNNYVASFVQNTFNGPELNWTAVNGGTQGYYIYIGF